MSVVSVNARSFILALFIRDDGERFLLGDNGYDFKDSQLHFAANTIENDEVVKQGTDGVMVAGQVRRSSVQSFDGYVGDATMAKETIEQMRRDFFAFFVKGHHFRVVYIDCNRNAWQRKGGYLVDAPEVKELWQIHPEYHVGLNFEDVNYYSYDEDASGEEILSNLVDVPVSTAASGGLVWDEDGAVSEDAEVEYITETAEASGKAISISDAAEAPLASFQLDGETSQSGTPTPSAPVAVQTVTGENVVYIAGKNIYDSSEDSIGGYLDSSGAFVAASNWHASGYIGVKAGEQYTISGITTPGQAPKGCYYNSARQFVSSFNNGNQTITIPSGICYVRLSIFNGVGGDNIPRYDSATLQLELGSTATAYEPYQGQSHEVNLDLEHGKNMLDPSTLVDGYISVNGEYNTAHSADEMRSGMIAVSPSTAYTFSIQATSSTFDPWFGVGEYTSDNVASFVQRDTNNAAGATSITFTTSATTNYIAVSARNLKTATKVQLEQGSSATTYEPWSPLELCKIGDYQDYIWNDNGTWKKHKAVGKAELANGTNWRKLNTTSSGSRYSVKVSNTDIPIAESSSALVNMYSNYWQAGTRLNTYNELECIALTSSVDAGTESFIAYVDSLKGGDVNSWKSWLTANSPVVYYPSTDPADETITNEALIEQLEAVLGGRTYAGTNNIFAITPNEQGTLEIGYYTEYQPVVVGGGYVWEAGGTGGATVVVNNSIDNVSPIWKVYGPTLNPQLENSTNGETIEYVGMVGDGQTLTIDMGEQTASLDGLNVISDLVGDFISLAPGANRLIYSVTGDAGASEIGWSEIVG